MARNPFEGERTLADAERDGGGGVSTSCVCGGETLVLQAFSEVTGGQLATRPIELETLTCPECGREYEPVELEDGRIVRGDYLGQIELEGEADDIA